MSDDGVRGDDALLDALGKMARTEEQDADALWDAVTAKDGAELPPDGPDLEALRPLDATERADLVEGLFGAAPPKTTAPVIDLAARRRRRMVSGGLGLALAAGLALFVFSRPPALPSYALEMRAGEQVLRGEGVESHTYTQGSVLSAVLRPDTDADGPVDLAVVLLPEGGEARALTLRVQRTDSGAVRATGILGKEIDVGPGAHRLVFLLAPEGGLPADVRVAHTEAPPGGHRLQHDFRVSNPH